jgi:hypothetical protein
MRLLCTKTLSIWAMISRGMLEASLDFPQQLFLFVAGHLPPSEVAFSNAPPTDRNSNLKEVTASTKRL